MIDYASIRIEVAASAIHPTHEPNFNLDWPDGMQEYGVVLFHNAVMLRDRDGMRERPPGTWIVYRPYEPRCYRSLRGVLDHTWILAVGAGVARCLEEYAVPTNLAFEFGGLDFMETYIKEVRQEQLEVQPYFDDAITDLSWEFFRRAGVLISDSDIPRTPRHRRKVEMFREIRLQVHTQPYKRWSVREMAELASMNPTRFAMDYQAQFGMSPIDDLIDARMRRAEYILKNNALPVKQVAAECGFTSPEHFSRLFHQRRGCSPGRYRRM